MRYTNIAICTLSLASIPVAHQSFAQSILKFASVEATKPVSNCPTFKADAVVRIKIPKGFDVSAETRNVRFRLVGDPGADTNASTSSPVSTSRSEDIEFSELSNPPVTTDAFLKNSFHFMVSEMFPQDKPTLIKVLVYLQDINYRFKRTVPVIVNGSEINLPVNGILATDESKGMICQKIDAAGNGGIVVNKGRSVLIFYVNTTVRSGKTADLSFVVESNNLYTDPDWGKGTPILIDPKIKNDG